MAKNDNLTDFLTSLADTIRTKTNTTEPINPQDFDSKIMAIEGAGGLKVWYTENYESGVLTDLSYTVDFEPYAIFLSNNDSETVLRELASSVEHTSNKLAVAYKLYQVNTGFAENQTTYSLHNFIYYILEGENFYLQNTNSGTSSMFKITENEEGTWTVTMDKKADKTTSIYRIVNSGQYPLQVMIIGK